MFYLGELNVLYVLVPWEHQDFYNVKGGNIWIFSQQLCPNLLIPNIKKKILFNPDTWGCYGILLLTPCPSTFHNQSIHFSRCLDHWQLFFSGDCPLRKRCVYHRWHPLFCDHLCPLTGCCEVVQKIQLPGFR